MVPATEPTTANPCGLPLQANVWRTTVLIDSLLLDGWGGLITRLGAVGRDGGERANVRADPRAGVSGHVLGQRRTDDLLLITSLLLAVVALVPFGMQTLGRNGGSPVSLALFSGMMACIGGLLSVLWEYSVRKNLIIPDLSFVTAVITAPSSRAQ